MGKFNMIDGWRQICMCCGWPQCLQPFFWIQYLGDSYVVNSLAACEASKPRDEKIDDISTTIKIDFCFGSIVAESHPFWMIW